MRHAAARNKNRCVGEDGPLESKGQKQHRNDGTALHQSYRITRWPFSPPGSPRPATAHTSPDRARAPFRTKRLGVVPCEGIARDASQVIGLTNRPECTEFTGMLCCMFMKGACKAPPTVEEWRAAQHPTPFGSVL